MASERIGDISRETGEGGFWSVGHRIELSDPSRHQTMFHYVSLEFELYLAKVIES